jgi:hypothetical protein
VNCKVEFFDDDRKSIEHQWLVRNPNSPFPPRELVGESQKCIHIAEAGVEGSVGSFNWSPLDPNRQHYTVSISYRDGAFVEKWQITRVDRVLRAALTIERGPQWVKKNPTLGNTVFRCVDPEFVSTALATERPQSSSPNVHPGWKPNYRFDVPAAIVDPNGHLHSFTGRLRR